METGTGRFAGLPVLFSEMLEFRDLRSPVGE